MNLLTRDTDYAVRAILHMAKQGDVLVSTADLDRELKLPRPFMRKIFRLLQKENYLVSVKGHNGGFRIARPLAKIYLMDLMKVFQGQISFSDCLFKKKLCSCVHACPLRREIKAMEETLLKKLRTITLADLMKG